MAEAFRKPLKEFVGKMNSVVLCAISVSLWLIFSEQFHHRGTETAQRTTEKILFPTDS